MGSDRQQSKINGGSVFLGAMVGAICVLAVIGALAAEAPMLISVGLAGPWALLIGGAGGTWIAFVHRGDLVQDLRSVLSTQTGRARILLTGPFLLLAWFLIAQLSLGLLGAFQERPPAGGLLLSMSTLGLLVLGSHGAERLARSPFLGRLSPGWGVSLLVGIGVPFVGVLLLVAAGTTSGSGSAFTIFGVFRREELDLIPVLQLLLMLFGAALGAALLARVRRAVVAVCLLLLLGFLAFGLFTASRASFREIVEVEKERGLASMGLNLLRRLNDHDGDGFSSKFAGGDCDDRRRDTYPGAQDIPENGVDEDCSGSDAKPLQVAEEEPELSKANLKGTLPEKVNFLLLTIDTLRADLGYTRSDKSRDLSPHLDRLAARSTVFKNAYSLASYTSKSLAPMLLGRYASETHRTFEHFDRFSPKTPFIQETLQRAGIKTISVQGYWYFFFKGYGFERGWDELDSSAAPKHVVVDGDKSSNGDVLADRTIAQLETLASSEERFFMWTHWVDPHSEYVAHEGFGFGKGSRDRYDGEVAFVDAQIGRILKALEDKGLADSTIVMVTSDHGEAFSEHGMIRHGFELWEELVRVPLILHIPGASAREISERRSLIDTVATILKSFSLKIPRGGEAFVRGKSLTEDAFAEATEPLQERPVLVDMPKGPHNQERRAFYVGDLKITTSRGRVLGLYDLSVDPEEKNDLSEDEEKVEPLLSEMKQYLEGLQQIPARR